MIETYRFGKTKHGFASMRFERVAEVERKPANAELNELNRSAQLRFSLSNPIIVIGMNPTCELANTTPHQPLDWKVTLFFTILHCGVVKRT